MTMGETICERDEEWKTEGLIDDESKGGDYDEVNQEEIERE